MVKVASLLSRVASLVSTPLAPSDYLSLFRPLATPHRARVEAVRDEVPGVRTLVLRPGRGWQPHRAGQHVRLGVAIDGRVATRTFSISSAPGARLVELTIKAQGRVTTALQTLPVGTIVSLGPAQGSFVVPATGTRALFVTAGSGITPVMSMLRCLASRGALPDIAHVHHARTPADVIFGEELRSLAALNPRYRLTIIHTATDPRRFSAARLDELVPDWRTREAWACGPQALLDACTFPVHVERFGARLAPVAEATAGVVQFSAPGCRRESSSLDGPVPGVITRARSDGRTTLLVLAESAGLAPKHGCRMGICHTCDATMISGCVRDLRTGVAIDEPGARIQLCVCAASGDVAITL